MFEKCEVCGRRIFRGAVKLPNGGVVCKKCFNQLMG